MSNKIKPTSENADIAVINDFDSEGAEPVWRSETKASYTTLAISENTASEEGSSLSMPYKCKAETIYFQYISVDASVNANGFTFLMKGDEYNSNLVLVFYLKYNGNEFKYQTAINGISSEWTEYSVGFDQFTQTKGDPKTMTSDLVKNITKVVLNYKNYSVDDYYISTMLLDEIKLDGTITLDTNTKTPYEG